MPRDPREAFVERVKAIDPVFKRGDLRRFWPELRALVAMAPDRADLSRKKSHYLASLAARSLLRSEPREAEKFLDYADRWVNPNHLTPYFIEERRTWRHRADAALCDRRTSNRRSMPGP